MNSIIQVNNVKKYYGEIRGVENLSFQVEEGEIFGFLGPNGAGKTTTIKILVKIIKDYSGEIEILGKDLKSWGKDFFQKIGVSFEDPAVYSKLTALENLEFFSSFYKNHLNPLEVLKIVELENEKDQLVATFSKGMKKKLDLARAILPNPQILFLDEPLEGLDPGSARKLKDLFLEMKNKGKTIFLTTHNMYVADELCDRVAFIVDGSIKLIENPKELKVRMSKKVLRIEYIKDGEVLNKEFPLLGIGENEEFLNIIKNNKIRSIHTIEPTLEDVFLSVTGRRLV